jgi:uncharacterized protein (TIGR03435 family)
VTQAYALVVDAKGAKLQAAAGGGPPGCRRDDRADGLLHRSCYKITMADLAEALPAFAPQYVDMPVVDMTGLTGAYDFQLDWAPARLLQQGATDGRSLHAALSAELGLKLEKQKLPLPNVIVESVDRILPDK